MARLERQILVLLVLLLSLLSACVTGIHSADEEDVGTLMDESAARLGVTVYPRNRVKYPRAAEVKEKCPALTLREKQPSDLVKGRRRPLMDRLSFRYGDWEHADARARPLIPLVQLNQSALPTRIQLATLYITDVARNPRQLEQQQVRQLGGVLELIAMDGKSRQRPVLDTQPQFEMMPGYSGLSIQVEGIYQQAENEDVVCLLGCTFLPSSDGGLRFDNVQNSEGTKKLEKDCSIMVQLNYPLTYNLTSRVIRGTITSLHSPEDRYYFSPLTVSSQISAKSAYESTASDLVNTACSSDADANGDDEGKGNSTSQLQERHYKASPEEFCLMSRDYLSDGSVLDIEPTWKCNGTTSYCRKIGPFSPYKGRSSFRVDYNTSRAQILVQSFRYPCIWDTAAAESGKGVPMSFVLRLVPVDEAVGLARERTAVDGQTIVAEGYWTNSSNTLCMVACKLDDELGQADKCNSRVSLRIPLTLSITRRDIFKGNISSLLPADNADSFFPLPFHVKLEYNKRNLPLQLSSALRYNYSMLDQAGTVLTRNEPTSSQFRTSATSSWFKYPTLAGEAEHHYESLSEDLSFHEALKAKRRQQRFTYVNFDVVAIDQYLPFVWSGFVRVADEIAPAAAVDAASPLMAVNDTIVTQSTRRRRGEARKYLNCSGTITFTGGVGGLGPRLSAAVPGGGGASAEIPSLSIYTEGYYSPADGKMYMVGCRSIKASWQEMNENDYDLVDGMDCEIEIVLEYPTTLAAWLLSPGVKVKVHSNRVVDDMFHFTDIDTETHPVLYKKQREALLTRKSVEGALSIITLSLMLVCIILQLVYVGSHADSAPFVSLLMLGVQALGYAVPLITGAGSLLTRKFDYRKDYFFQYMGSTQVIMYADKIVTLVALLLLMRLFEKVRRERALQAEQQQQEQQNSAKVPREGTVLLFCLVIHAMGFLLVLALHFLKSPEEPARTSFSVPGSTPKSDGTFSTAMAGNAGAVWQVTQEYAGLIDDLFLLPQVIAFSLWEVTGKPLRFIFFMGLTLLQIVPHMYDSLRDPTFDFYPGYTIYANPRYDFYTDVGNVLIPILALLLAVLVYCQQRWKGFLRFKGDFRYQQLGAKAGETELVTNNGRNHLPPIPEDDE